MSVQRATARGSAVSVVALVVRVAAPVPLLLPTPVPLGHFFVDNPYAQVFWRLHEDLGDHRERTKRLKKDKKFANIEDCTTPLPPISPFLDYLIRLLKSIFSKACLSIPRSHIIGQCP